MNIKLYMDTNDGKCGWSKLVFTVTGEANWCACHNTLAGIKIFYINKAEISEGKKKALIAKLDESIEKECSGIKEVYDDEYRVWESKGKPEPAGDIFSIYNVPYSITFYPHDGMISTSSGKSPLKNLDKDDVNKIVATITSDWKSFYNEKYNLCCENLVEW